jgi:guanylate kinase
MSGEQLGHTLIFSGPHGAGKDTLENRFRLTHPSAHRVVRHITRPAAPTEVDGVDYHFVDTERFQRMVDNDAFIEHSTYPDCMAGTSRQEVTEKRIRGAFTSLAANFEEGLDLNQKLKAAGIPRTCLFISPVSLDVFLEEPATYINALRMRMSERGRPDDRIENKIAKAVLYREIYLETEEDIPYIDNSAGRQLEAAEEISAIALQVSCLN